MKKKRKLLIALLSVACMTTSVAALSACDNQADAPNPSVEAIYQEYASKTDNPLTYDEWLLSIKGETGPQGTPGTPGSDGKSAYQIYLESLSSSEVPLSEEEWIASLKGDAGKGVSKVELNADGTKLVITYTDNTTQEVGLPDAFHVHTYGETVTIIEPTTTTEGLGYKTCSADGHVEMVVLPKLAYTVSLKLPDGSPAVGFTVAINGGEAETDENGMVTVADFGALGVYSITVTDPDGEYTTVGTTKTNATKLSYELTLAKKIVNGTITESGTYAVSVGWDRYGYANSVSVALLAGEENTSFKVFFDEEIDGGCRKDSEYDITPDTSTEYTIDVAAGQSQTIYLSFNDYNYSQSEYPDGISYAITVEVTEGVPEGGSLNIPLTLSVGDNSATVETEDKTAYFAFSGFELDGTEYAKLTFDDSVKVQIYAYTDWSGNLAAAPLNVITANNATLIDCTSGEATVALNQWSNNYFKVTTTDPDGEVNITVDNYYQAGTMNNPLSLADLGTANIGSLKSYGYVYFTFSVEETGDYTIIRTAGSAISLLSSTGGSIGYYALEDIKGVYSLTADTQYLLRVSPVYNSSAGSYSYDFTVRKYNAEADLGISENYPVQITLSDNKGEVSFNAANPANKTMYYTTHIPAGYGRLLVTVTDSSGNEMKTFEAYGSTYNIFSISYSDSDSGLYNVTAEGGKDVSLKLAASIMYSAFDGQYKLSLEWVPIVAVDHTFTVKSGETLIGGVTVGLYEVGADEDAEAVATGVTNASGVATIKVLPGVYEVRLTNLNSDTYKYATVVRTDLPADGSKDNGADYDIEVDSKTTYTVNIGELKNGVFTPVQASGVSVLLMNGNETVATAQTNASGVATFSVFPGNYTVSIANDSNYQYIIGDIEDNECDVTRITKVAYTFTVLDKDEQPVEGILLTVTDQYGNTATGTTNSDGTVTLTDKVVPGVNKVTGTGSVIPEGYGVSGKTSADSSSLTLYMEEEVDSLSGTYDIGGGTLATVGEVAPLEVTLDGTYVITFTTTGSMKYLFYQVNDKATSTDKALTLELNAGDQLRFAVFGDANKGTVTIALQAPQTPDEPNEPEVPTISQYRDLEFDSEAKIEEDLTLEGIGYTVITAGTYFVTSENENVLVWHNGNQVNYTPANGGGYVIQAAAGDHIIINASELTGNNNVDYFVITEG